MIQIKVINTPSIQPFADIDLTVYCIHRMTNFSMRQPIEVIQTIYELADTMPDFTIVQIQTAFEKDQWLDRLQEKQMQSPTHQSMRDKYVELLRSHPAMPSTIDQFYLIAKITEIAPIIAEMGKHSFTMDEIPEDEVRAITTAPLKEER